MHAVRHTAPIDKTANRDKQVLTFFQWIVCYDQGRYELLHRHEDSGTVKKAKFKYAIPQLPSGDIEKTADFCESKLGFEVWAKYPEQKHLIVGRGDVELHFWQTDSEETANELGSQSSCYVRVKNIEAFFSELKENHAPFHYELKNQPWGMKEMQIDDPYGNAIRFGEPTE